MPGATLTLTSDAFTRSAVANSSGSFHFEDVVSGDSPLTLQVALPGFEPGVKEGIVIEDGQTATVDFALKLGCIYIIDNVVFRPIEQLQVADLVAHIRIAAESEQIRTDTVSACQSFTVTTATIVNVAKARRPEWRSGRAIVMSEEVGDVLEAGSDYLVFLSYDETLRRFNINGVHKIDRGRAPLIGDLGVRGSSAIDDAVSRLRRLARSGRPDLESLRFQTGWLSIGTLARDSDTWTNERAFDFVTRGARSRELPRAGDRIRIKQVGWLFIRDFTWDGAARRLSPPRGARTDFTGAVVNTLDVYRVEDIVTVDQKEGERLVWVRLVASNP